MAIFKTFGMQNGDRLILFLRSFRKVRFPKMQFLKDGVQTVGEFDTVLRAHFFVSVSYFVCTAKYH